MKKLPVFLILCLFVTGASAISFKSPAQKQDAQWNAIHAETCTDSDKGTEYFKKGTIKSYDPLSKRKTVFTDECAIKGIATRSNKCAGKYCGVIEGYCGDKGFGIDKNYICPGGCKNGACVEITGAANRVGCLKECSGEISECEPKCPKNNYVRKNCITDCRSAGQRCKTKCPRY